MDVEHLRLDLAVDLPARTVTGQATLTCRSLRPLTSLRLDAVEFTVEKVELVRGKGPAKAARFHHDGKHLALDVDPALPAGETAEVRVAYRVSDPRSGLHFFGPTEAEPDVPLTVWSQGQAVTNRYWIPCLDQPNERQSTELVVTVAEGLEVLSNGELVERKVNGTGTTTFHWKQALPHPSYLMTLVVGKFDVVRDEWNRLPLLYYVPAGRKDDVGRTFGRTREMLDFFSRRFGVAYPWEKYAQVVVEQFTSGGMENTSATTLTDRALHDARAILDSDADGLIAHELAHQWWGNLVTCRDWAHLWLNEGFASYAEALWYEHSKGPDAYACSVLLKARAALAGGKERPIVDRRYTHPDRMFDARAYPKGAFVLHMLRHRLGEDGFWKAIQRYAEEHRLQSIETRDLRSTLERVTGRDLERFFYDWTERPGHPVLEAATDHDAEARVVRVRLKQTQSGEPFHFPLPVRITLPGAKEPLLIEQEVTAREHNLTVPVPERPLRIEIDPEQAVLAEVREDKSRALWLAQLTGSTSAGSRVLAAEQLARSKAPGDAQALAAALAGEKFWGVQVEIARALGEHGGDAARDALLAGLKQENPRVRRACAEQLGKFRRDPRVAEALRGLLQKGDASYFVEAAALTAYAKLGQADTVNVLLPWLARPSHNEVIRSAVLEGLGKSGDASALDTVLTWARRGKPRLARLAALAALPGLSPSTDSGRQQQIVRELLACLDGEGYHVRRAAVTALGELGSTASGAAETLDNVARQAPEERLREAARKAAVSVRSQGPLAEEVKKLREEVDRLKRQLGEEKK